jgi:hypothetical protein
VIDPLLRHAVGFVRRAPGWALAVCLATAALAAAAATPPLVSDAAADRSFTEEVAAASDEPPGGALDGRAITTGIVDEGGTSAVIDLLDEMPVYGRPVVAVSPLLPYTDSTGPLPVIRNQAGDQLIAVVYALDGAVESLGGGGGDEGVWVPDTTAEELGLHPGDPVDVALVRPNANEETAIPPVPTLIAGVYPTRDGLPVSEGFDWTAVTGAVPDDPVAHDRPARLLLADRATALSLIATMGDTSLVTWDVPWQEAVDLQHGRDAADAVEEADLQLRNTDSAIGRIVHDAGGQPVRLSSGVESFVDRSEQAAAELQPLVTSIALTARVMSALVLAVGIWLLTRGRRREHQLSMSMGIHPIRLAVTTAIELLVPLVAGVSIAYVVVRWYPHLIAGEGAIDARTISAAASKVLRTLPFAGIVVVAAAFASVLPLEPNSAGRVRKVAFAVHADTIVVVAAIATGAQLITQRGRTLDSGTSLLFPLFAQLAGAVVVVRVASALGNAITRLRSRRDAQRPRRPRSLAVWLAARRATAWLGELSALVIVVAAGVGLFVYSTSVATNGERGVSDKAAALGGAMATVQIASTDGMNIGTSGFPVGLPPAWTVLWATTDVHVGVDLVTDVLMVDPSTFAAAVDWRPSFAEKSLPSLLTGIDDGNAATIDVVLAGNYNDDFPDTGTMAFDRAFVRYRVVDRIAAASWIQDRSSMMLVSAPLFAAVMPVDPNVDPPLTAAATMDRRFRTFVWAHAPAAQVVARLGPVALDEETMNTVTAARTPEFVAFGMSLPYLRIVGIGLLVVALVSIVVLGARRRADLAMEIAMTDRMGIARRTTTIAVAGGAALLGLIGSMIGIVIAIPLETFMIHRLDPGPSFAPGFDGGLSPTAVMAAASAVVLVSVAGALVEVRGARRARVVEVLRAAE